MGYKIKAEYSSGDSNGSWDESKTLEMEWESLPNAKAALKRIEDHWRWYNGQVRGWDNIDANGKKLKAPPRPEWMEAGLYESSIIVLLDNGNPVRFNAPWCGYFERLYRCSILAELPYFEA